MKRVSNTGIVIAILVIAGAVAFGLRSVSTETEVLPPIDLPDPTDEPTAAVVVGRTSSGGFKLFGLQLGTVTHTIRVTFYGPPDCLAHVTTGEAWPLPDEECASAVPITGVVSGSGIAQTGDAIITVDVDVTKDCYDTIELGADWPPSAAACG